MAGSRRGPLMPQEANDELDSPPSTHPSYGSKTAFSSPIVFPLANRDAFIPGTNAFARRLELESAQHEAAVVALLQQPLRASREVYSVSMYSGMQPSSPFRGSEPSSPRRRIVRDTPQSNDSQPFSEVPETPKAKVSWQEQSLPHSEQKPGLGQRQAQGHQLGLPRSLDRENERLQLVPSPDPNVRTRSTYRMELDERARVRLQPTADSSTPSRVGGGYTSLGHIIRGKLEATTSLKHAHSNKSGIQGSSVSPGKKFLNKIGLSGLSLKPSPPRAPLSLTHPTKPVLRSYRAVPPKAARTLETQSLGNRYQPRKLFGEMSESREYSPTRDGPPVLPEEHRRVASLNAMRRLQLQREQRQLAKEKEEKLAKEREERQFAIESLKKESKEVPASSNVGSPEHYRDFSDDNPPTPPSKTTLRERFAEQEKMNLAAQSSPTFSDNDDTASPTSIKTYKREDSSQPKSGPTGNIDRPRVAGEPSSAIETSRKVFDSDDSDLQHHTESRPATVPSINVTRKGSDSSRRRAFYIIPEGGILLPTVYKPPTPKPKVKVSASQPSPHSNLSVSPTQLRPEPLTIAQANHPGQEQSPHLPRPTPQASREASNSTSASVPIYLDTPSTGKLDSAKLTEMAAAVSSKHGASPWERVATKDATLKHVQAEPAHDDDDIKITTSSTSERVLAPKPALSPPKHHPKVYAKTALQANPHLPIMSSPSTSHESDSYKSPPTHASTTIPQPTIQGVDIGLGLYTGVEYEGERMYRFGAETASMKQQHANSKHHRSPMVQGPTIAEQRSAAEAQQGASAQKYFATSGHRLPTREQQYATSSQLSASPPPPFATPPQRYGTPHQRAAAAQEHSEPPQLQLQLQLQQHANIKAEVSKQMRDQTAILNSLRDHAAHNTAAIERIQFVLEDLCTRVDQISTDFRSTMEFLATFADSPSLRTNTSAGASTPPAMGRVSMARASDTPSGSGGGGAPRASDGGGSVAGSPKGDSWTLAGIKKRLTPGKSSPPG